MFVFFLSPTGSWDQLQPPCNPLTGKALKLMDKQWVKALPDERSRKDQVVANSSKNGHKYTFYLSMTNCTSYGAWVAHREHVLATSRYTVNRTFQNKHYIFPSVSPKAMKWPKPFKPSDYACRISATFPLFLLVLCSDLWRSSQCRILQFYIKLSFNHQCLQWAQKYTGMHTVACIDESRATLGAPDGRSSGWLATDQHFSTRLWHVGLE